MTDAWGITAPNVLAEAGNPASKDLGFASDAARDTHITNILLPAVEDLIEEQLGQTYTSTTVPVGLLHIALRMAAQGLIKIGVRKMGSLIRVGDWKVELSDPTILTPEVKAEIETYRTKTYPTFYEQPIE